MSIKAIETRYKGYRFRSRLEARWAVFFDALELPWRYEPEGFDLGEAGWYLPDFYLPEWDTYIEVKPTMPNVDEMFKVFMLSRAVNANRKEALSQLMLCGTPGAPPTAVRDQSGIKVSFGCGYAGISISGQIMGNPPHGYLPSAWPGLPLMWFSAFAMTQGGTCLDVWPMYFTYPGDLSTLPWDLRPINARGLGKDDELWTASPTSGWLRRFYMGEGVCYDAPTLMTAYQIARSARFEHGETPN